MNIAAIFRIRLTGPRARCDSQLAPSMHGLSFRLLPYLVLRLDAQDLLRRRRICTLQGTVRIFSRAGGIYDSSLTTATIRMGTTTSSPSSHCTDPAQTHPKLAQSETNSFFLPYMGSTAPHGLRGPHLRAHESHLARCPRPTISAGTSTTTLGCIVDS